MSPFAPNDPEEGGGGGAAEKEREAVVKKKLALFVFESIGAENKNVNTYLIVYYQIQRVESRVTRDFRSVQKHYQQRAKLAFGKVQLGLDLNETCIRMPTPRLDTSRD